MEMLDELEQITRKLLQQPNYSIEVYTPEGDAVFVNDGWRRLWNMPTNVMLNAYNILEDTNLQTKHTWEAIRQGFEGLAGSTPAALFSPEEIGMPGRIRWTDGYVAPVLDEDGHVTRVALILRDITEAKLAIDEIARLRNELQKLQAQQDAMLKRLDKVEQRDALGRYRQSLPPVNLLLADVQRLSRRELQVLELIAADKPVKEIAFDLDLSIKSVYTYRARLLEKLSLTSDIQLARAYDEIIKLRGKPKKAAG